MYGSQVNHVGAQLKYVGSSVMKNENIFCMSSKWTGNICFRKWGSYLINMGGGGGVLIWGPPHIYLGAPNK